MEAKSRPSKHQDNALSLLNVAIEGFNLTKEILSVTPAKAVCGSVSVILTMIRVRLPPARADLLQADTHPGLDRQRGGLR